MKQIGFIPLRKGSKGIPNKNKRKIGGRPLFSWVLNEAILSNLDHIYVATDDDHIRAYIQNNFKWTNKITVVNRSSESANDSASTETAINEFCKSIKYDFDVFCLLQATSPFTTAKDINTSLEKLSNYDSVLTVAKTHRFIWTKEGKPLNYDYLKRPRRQDFDGLFVENGAIYVNTKKGLQKSDNRLAGNVGIITMSEESYHEIDSETDWHIAEQLLLNRLIKNKEMKKITHLILDVDGVFTNGTVAYSSDGELTKNFDMRDGMGLEIIRELGIEVMVITSEDSELVKARMKKLQIDKLYSGVKDKYSRLRQIIDEEGISPGEIAYGGDDINDLAAMCFVGWSFAPQNAMTAIKNYADVLLTKNGGEGAIREICEFIIKYNKRYE